MSQANTTITVSITDGIATLPDGTTVDLKEIQATCNGVFQETGEEEYMQACDNLSLLTGLEQGPFGEFVPSQGVSERYRLSALAQGLDELSVWDELEEFPVTNWRAEVENDDTRLGYKDWVKGQIEQQLEDLEF